MSVDSKRPLLRKSLDIFPVEHEGQHLVAVRDPLGLADEPILVPGEILFLMSLMDGKKSVTDIQIAFTRKYGELIMSDRIQSIVNELDSKGYMESPAYTERVRRIEEAYRSAPMREASHAGQAYPDSISKLRAMLEEIVPRPAETSEVSAPPAPRGLVAPHIDIERGRSVYGLAYASLMGTRPPHTVVIFGTGHFAEGNTYILTCKDFATPLGTARVDKEFCDIIAKECGFDITRGELCHRSEHSIEFQVLFLQHVFGNGAMPLIVPILCTSLDETVESGKPPSDLPEVQGFLAGLAAAAEACPGGVLLIAGADMCHVGPKFGSDAALNQTDLDRIRAEDVSVLEEGVSRGAEAFFQAVASIGNRNHICSIVSIYTILKHLEGETRELMGYDQAVEPEGYAAVGFAALRIG
jgi:AmmeMemoRadiSam system protein B